MARSKQKVYQLKVLLEGSKPPIWRRILVRDSVTLDELHAILQIVMGWTDSHLHQFIANRNIYGVPDPEFDFEPILDERDFKLKDLLKKEKQSIRYEYDFGDGWMHKITLEKILPYDPDTALPICIKARGACPPEDVGGIWGYYNFLEAISDKKHPEHQEYKEWIGGEFDPAAYDIQGVNELLQSLGR